MNLPHALIQAAASQVLPGCFWLHGEQELANIKLDETSSTDRIVFLDDKMPFRFNVNKYKQITGLTCSCLIMLLVPSDLNDTPEQRLPRSAAMVDASARFLADLGMRVQNIKQVRPAEIMAIGPFDRPVDGVTLFLDITLKGTVNVCLPLDQPQA
ncbi:hypothetical protein MUN82_03945 [Hymenobacter aerilatus]|uniref:Uncharacterized protein n=1 Tax=Hymenobacter aerilatus TaxID=2932251 RepID=A0A8T9SXZ1_9BACT|nr:hypothetical protein [Hymenobacter aerilatus]UOR06251.1 hypothetical protein MUN82_03945 [Hymenobacter aerilatus]